MNNAGIIIHRLAGSCLPGSRIPQRQLPRPSTLICGLHYPQASCRGTHLPWPGQQRTQPSKCLQIRELSSTCSQAIRQAFDRPRATSLPRSKQGGKEEKGLSFRKGDLSQEELHDVFGAVVPPAPAANHLLRVLHGRRNDGTLDLPLPISVQATTQRYPYAFNSALGWLRERYPIDEDAAIVARIEREEAPENYSPSELQERAQELGLYGPQSGNYHANLSEREEHVWGNSELERIRKANEAAAEREERELEIQVDNAMAEAREKQKARRKDKSKALAKSSEQGLEPAREIRRPNEYEKWVLKAKNRATSRLTLASAEVIDMSFLQRVLPSAVFVAIVCIGSYFFAQYWIAPKRSERLFPDVSLTYATIAAILTTNLCVYGAWAFPPLWIILNKYFISTPAFPRAFSMVGNIFSHQSFKHLMANCLGILIFGSALHEDVGRGTFMGLYLASGAVGSLLSLTQWAAKRVFITSSLGASGSVCGIFAAYCWLHSREKFSVVFLPDDWKDTLSFKGSTLLALLFVYEFARTLSPTKTIDHISHFGGLIVGLIIAEFHKRDRANQTEGQKKKERTTPDLQQLLTGQVPSQEKQDMGR